MKYSILTTLFTLILSSNSLSGQTKMIAYKSHSGSSANMHQAILEELFSSPNSNLGAVPERFIRNAVLDSLIFIDDTSTVMVTSTHCGLYLVKNDKEKNKNIWQEGRDTVYHHTTFNQEFSEDTIRKIIKQTYHFANDANDIVFVDHQPSEEREVKETKAPKKKKKKKVKKSKSTKAPKKGLKRLFNKPGCTTFILLCSAALGASYRRRKK